MEKINLSITKCKKCGFRIISQEVKKKCPLCNGQLVKDRGHQVQGMDTGDDSSFITLRKKTRGPRK